MVRKKAPPRSSWFYLLGSPVVWGAHFLVSYLWVEAVCQAGPVVLDATILGLTAAAHVVLALTLVSVIAASYVGWSAYRRWRELSQGQDQSASPASLEEGKRFMAFSGMVLSLLFAPIILLTGLPVLVLNPC